MNAAARVVVVGATGRLGRLVCEQATVDPGVELVGTVSRTTEFDRACDVVIDCSTPEGTLRAVHLARRAGAGLVVATTGLGDAGREAVEGLSRERAVLVAPNLSLGVAVLRGLVEDAARRLGPGWTVEIVESHHARKKDAPSGTALSLAEASARGGLAVPRERIHSLRGGDVVGEHTVRFGGEGEYLELRHVATTRALFARGAVVAAKWLAGRPAGRYTMADVLGE